MAACRQVIYLLFYQQREMNYTSSIFILLLLTIVATYCQEDLPLIPRYARKQIATSLIDDIPVLVNDQFICFISVTSLNQISYSIHQFTNTTFGDIYRNQTVNIPGTITKVLANFAGEKNEVIHIFVQLQGSYSDFYTIITDVNNNSPTYTVLTNTGGQSYEMIASCTAYSFAYQASAIAIQTNDQFKVVLLNFRDSIAQPIASIPLGGNTVVRGRIAHFPPNARSGLITVGFQTSNNTFFSFDIRTDNSIGTFQTISDGRFSYDLLYDDQSDLMVSGAYGANGLLVQSRVYDSFELFYNIDIADGDLISFEPDLFNVLLRPQIKDIDYGSVFISMPTNNTHFLLWKFSNIEQGLTYYYEIPDVPNLKYVSIAPIHPTSFVMYYTDSLATVADYYVFDVCGDGFITGTEQCVPGHIGCLSNCTCSTEDGYQPFDIPQANCAPVCNDGVLGENECYDGVGCSNMTCTCIEGYQLGSDHICSKIVAPLSGGPLSIFNENPPTASVIATPSSPIEVIVPAIVVPVVVVMGVGVFLIIFFMRRQKKKHTITSINMENISKYASLEDRMSVPYKQLKFIKEIGSGGFGKVYIGEWQKTKVALKVNTGGQIEDFLTEARLMINMRPHPNIVQILGVSVDGPHLVMIIEYCDGGSLDKLLFDTNAPISHEQQFQYASAIAQGMLHLHSNGLIHRDLAARNILLNKGVPKISDFGMSRMLQEVKQATTKTNIGPVRWMAPESLKQNVYSKPSDVWSFGIVLYEITARQEPHANGDIFDVVPKIRDHGLTPEMAENTDRFLAELMKQCWNFEPESRPAFEVICDNIDAEMSKYGYNHI